MVLHLCDELQYDYPIEVYRDALVPGYLRAIAQLERQVELLSRELEKRDNAAHRASMTAAHLRRVK